MTDSDGFVAQPTNVHCGGPYVARSEYDKQADLLHQLSLTLKKTEQLVEASHNAISSLIKERNSLRGDVEILKGVNADLKKGLLGPPALKKPDPPAWLCVCSAGRISIEK